MRMQDLVTYWSKQCLTAGGAWAHPGDAASFANNRHTINLDFPVSPFLGNILEAPIIILGANAGYNVDLTPTEFPNAKAIEDYLARVNAPSSSNWSNVASYYRQVNYGHLIAVGRVALINACAYRSPKIGEEALNRRLIEKLESVAKTREWLQSALLPLAAAGERLIVAKRPGLWRFPQSVRCAKGVVFDRAPISPHLTGDAWAAVQRWKA